MKEKKLNSIFERIKGAFFIYVERLYRKYLYTSIEDETFTMKSYLKIVCDDNLSGLKKRPIFSINAILLTVWSEILLEYADKAKNKEIKARMDRQGQIQLLYNRITILRGCFMALSVVPEESRIIKFLADSGIKAKGHSEMIKRLESEIKSISIRIKEMAALNKVDEQQPQKVTRSDYSLIFVSLKKAGYQASIDMPVIDFINTKNMYAQEVERQNREIENIKTKRNGKL